VAEAGLTSRHHEDDVAGGVIPVAGSLHPGAIGSVGFHRDRQVFQGSGDDGFGVLRIGLGDGEGTDGQAAVAHHVPVVFGLDAPTWIRAQSVFDQASLDDGAGFLVHGRVEPVVADADGVAHLGGVEVVLFGVPVREGADGEEIGDAGIGVFAIPGPTPGETEGDATIEAIAAGGEQAQAVGDDVFQRLLLELAISNFEGVLDITLQDCVGLGELLQAGQICIFHEEPRVALVESGEDIRGYGVAEGRERGFCIFRSTCGEGKNRDEAGEEEFHRRAPVHFFCFCASRGLGTLSSAAGTAITLSRHSRNQFTTKITKTKKEWVVFGKLNPLTIATSFVAIELVGDYSVGWLVASLPPRAGRQRRLCHHRE
jgi:hypothetical protein